MSVTDEAYRKFNEAYDKRRSGTALANPNPYELLSLPHPDEASAHVSMPNHPLGTFSVSHLPGVIDRLSRMRSISAFTYAQYVHAVGTIETIKNRYDRHGSREEWEKMLREHEEKFQPHDVAMKPPRQSLTLTENTYRLIFTRGLHTPDPSGYLAYLKLADPSFHAELTCKFPLLLPEDARIEHTYVVAGSGSGKTELLKLLIHSYVTHPDYAAVVAIAPDGDFLGEVARWTEFAAGDRLIYVDPALDLDHTPTINPFEISGIDPTDTSKRAIAVKQVIAQQLLNGLDEVIAAAKSLSDQMRTVLLPCILTLLDLPGATLRDLQRFMQDKHNADLIEFGRSRTHYESVASFFAEGADGFGKPRFSVTKDAIYTRFQQLFNTGIFTRLTCGKSTIDLEQVINDRKVILFNLSKGSIGSLEGSAFGRLVVVMLQGIAERRANQSKQQRVPCHLFIDECQNYITASIADIMRESRKYKLIATLSQQVIGDGMTPKMEEIVTLDTNLQIAGRVAHGAASKTASFIGVDKSSIPTLPKGGFYLRWGGRPPLQMRTHTHLLGRANAMPLPLWRRTKRIQLRTYYRSLIEPTREETPAAVHETKPPLDKDEPAAPTPKANTARASKGIQDPDNPEITPGDEW